MLFGIALFGLIIVAGYLAGKLFEKTHVPDVLLLIALGMVLGPLTGLVRTSLLGQAMPFAAALALVIIMLAAGQRFNLMRVASILPSNSVFSFFAYFLSSALITLVAHFVFGWDLLHAAFLAFVVSDTCPTIVGALVSRLRSSEATRISLSLEASISGALSGVCAILVLRFLSAQSLDASTALHTLASAFAIAAVAGVVAALLWHRVLQRLDEKNFEYILTLAAAVFLYSGVEFAGGNGAISVLALGVVLGNYGELARIFSGAKPLKEREEYAFEDEVVFFVRTFFFVYIGIMFNFGVPFATLLLSLAALACILAARVVSMRLLAPKAEDYLLQAFVIPTGLSAIVLSLVPAAWGISIPGVTDAVLLIVVLTNVVTTVAALIHNPSVAARVAVASRPRVVGVEQRKRK